MLYKKLMSWWLSPKPVQAVKPTHTTHHSIEIQWKLVWAKVVKTKCSKQ